MNPEEVLSRLVLLYPRIYLIIQQAVTTAKRYFELNASEVDVYLFSDIVRNEVKKALDLLLNDPELVANGYSRRNLPNNGLEINYANYTIKILKSQGGYIPSAGRSIARQDFFYQPFLPFVEEQFLNLVLIWEVNSNNELVRLRLACPRQPMSYPESTSEYWSTNIPSSTLSMESVTSFDDPVEDLDIDLDIESVEATGTFGDSNDDN